MLSTSEAREKRVLFKQRYRANDLPLFLFRPGTSIAQCGKNPFEIGFEFYPTSDLTWQFLRIYIQAHTIYPGNNMCQKCGHKIGLWVLHEIFNKTYAENMKKIVGAVWELSAK